MGKGKVYLSADYAAWRAEAAWTARLEAGPNTIRGKFKIYADFVAPDKRHRDLDNLLKAVMDALQHGGVITNDKNCVEISAKWVTEGPPCKIILEEIKSEEDQRD